MTATRFDAQQVTAQIEGLRTDEGMTYAAAAHEVAKDFSLRLLTEGHPQAVADDARSFVYRVSDDLFTRWWTLRTL